jgi:hypothetical protein
MSCRDTTSHAPSAWPHVAHLRLPIISAGDWSSGTPTARRPTLPTHKSPIRHELRYRCDNARTLAGEMSHDLSVCHSRAPSRCEHLIMLRARQLLDSPTVRRLRSLIELLALDDKHTRTTLQFVSRQIGAAAMSVADQQPRVNHDPIDFIFGGQCLNTCATPSGTEENLECPFPHSPIRGMRPTAPCSPPS